MTALAIFYRPLSTVTFGRPSDLAVRATGPGALGPSMRYPMPSTLAGALAAALAVSNGLSYSSIRGYCRSSSPRGGCPESLLARYLGDRFHIYAGLSFIEGARAGELRYYTPMGYANAKAVEDFLRCAAEEAQGCSDVLKGRATSEPSRLYVRARLDRASRTVTEGYLYGVERLSPYVRPSGQAISRLSYVVLASVQKEVQVNAVVRFGGKGGVASIVASGLMRATDGTCEPAEPDEGGLQSPAECLVLGRDEWATEWSLMLTSPALLDDSPWGAGEVVEVSEDSARRLGEELVSESRRETGANIDVKIEKVVMPLRPDMPVTVLAPGWKTTLGSPKRPRLFVPPGLIIVLRGNYSHVRRLVEAGLGVDTRLGWGTIIAVPLTS